MTSTASISLTDNSLVIPLLAVAAGIILLVSLYTYIDYRKHRKPLVQADPIARQTYTYGHHIKTVTIPLLRYRIRISLTRQPKGLSKF